MPLPYYLALPLAAAAIYALGSVLLKRGLLGGGSADAAFHATNLVIGLAFLPLAFAPRSGSGAWHLPVANGTSFFLGGWLTFAAIRRGDVSLATPVMGTKVVFVAIAAVAFAGMELPPSLWVAAGLAAAGIATMGLGKAAIADVGRAAIWQCIGLSVLSALCYGLSDIMVQIWAEGYGATAYIADSSIVVALLSFAAAPFSRSARQGLRLRFPPAAKRWILWGAAAIAAQAMLMGFALGYFHDAPATNVVYATRGLWAIAIVWALGARLGMPEAIGAPKAVLRWRLAGALLLTGGVILAIIARA